MKRAERTIKFKDARGEFLETLRKEQNFKIEEEPMSVQEKLISEEPHEREDHYHGVHHFDKYGNHDDISSKEFSIKSQFPKSKKALTFRIAMAALVLGLSIAMSALDAVLEKFSINIGGVGFEMRIFDLLVIIIGIPIVGLYGSIGIGIIEPWFHFLIDSDHTPIQIALDSVAYAATVCIFFFVFYMLFKNSPIHKEPNKKKRWFKDIVPAFVIVPLEAIMFTAVFVLALYANYKMTGKFDDEWHQFIKNSAGLIFANFGIQIIRFIVMYVFFVFVETAMKPVNHRYR